MDISDEVLDQEASLFYENVRALVVVFLTISVLLPLSYIIVASRRKYKEPYLSKDDMYVHSFVMGICTATMTLSVVMFFMLPLSILANEVLILFPNCYYVQWISAGLLRTFFVFVQIAFKGTCILIPFGFFVLSSHSVYTGSKAVSSRFFYSILYLAITYLASFGALTTLVSTFALAFKFPNFASTNDFLTKLLPRACLNSTFFYYSWPLQLLGDIICCVNSSLTLVQQFISYIGLGLLLICIPSGISSIIIQMMKVSTTQSLRSLSNDIYIWQLIDESYHLQLQQCLKYIENLNEPLRHSLHLQFDKLDYRIHSCSSVDAHYHLSSLESKDSFGVNSLSWDLKEVSPKTGRSLLSSLAFLFLLSVLLAAALYASMNVTVLLYQLLTSRTHGIADHSSRDAILLGHESASKFGFIGASLQALMVVFVICISLFGFYSLPLVCKHIYPRTHSAGMALLLFNATCILSMSSAVPLQASFLGLATPSFPPVYYSTLDEGFCRPASCPCLQSPPPSSLLPDPTHYLNGFHSAAFSFKGSSKPPHDHSLQPQHQQRDLLRMKGMWKKQQHTIQQQHQHHLGTMPLSSPPPTRELMIMLVYNFSFIAICWWLFRLYVRDLVKARQPLVLMGVEYILCVPKMASEQNLQLFGHQFGFSECAAYLDPMRYVGEDN
ncbi:Limb region 1 protein [Echinococcus granulosus]|uniref:Limb region 1 protein n=1 Tax=Echinococcus granulosus TaxID=6210 RepID=W6UUE0_ECHGR|nr:Limb region 1 protein [Echinococcus granulosus]EUB64286.1 Limb region 1 protein [Echinococcus granulosus]